jgi:hypothetical protein
LSRGSSRHSSSTNSPRAGSSSTTPPRVGLSSTNSPTPRVWVPRHIARLVTRLVAPLFVDYSASRRLVVDYFASATRPGASVLTVYFGAPRMFITLWFGFDYGANPPLGTLII